MQRVNIETRRLGEGTWGPLTLPVTIRLAQTLAAAARTLQLGDQIRIVPRSGVGLDIKV